MNIRVPFILRMHYWIDLSPLTLIVVTKKPRVEILQKKTGVTNQDANEIVRLVSSLRAYGKGFSPSLRASLMMSSIAKKVNIPIIPENKHYQALCLDVLTRPVKQLFPDLHSYAVRELILKELLRKEDS